MKDEEGSSRFFIHLPSSLAVILPFHPSAFILHPLLPEGMK
jgi:hypothetical protein